MNDRSRADDPVEGASAFFLALATVAIVLGIGIVSALRGAAVGLDQVIERVDLGAALLAQATALVALLVGVTRSLPFVMNTRPWPVATLVVLGTFVCSLLGIAASRASLPDSIVASGAAFFGVGLALFGILGRVRPAAKSLGVGFAFLVLAETMPDVLALVGSGSILSRVALSVAQTASLVIVLVALALWSRASRTPLAIASALLGALLGALVASRSHPGVVWSFSHSLFASLTDGGPLPAALAGALLVPTAIVAGCAWKERNLLMGFAALLSLIALAPKSPLTLMVASAGFLLCSGLSDGTSAAAPPQPAS